MMEAQQPGMQAEAVQRIVTVAILLIATDRMPQIGRMYTNLILTSCLQAELYQRVLCRAV